MLQVDLYAHCIPSSSRPCFQAAQSACYQEVHNSVGAFIRQVHCDQKTSQFAELFYGWLLIVTDLKSSPMEVSLLFLLAR